MIRRAGTALVLVAAFALAAAPAEAGPPWISVEYPTNPHHPSTRGAAFLVHVYHHTTAIEATVTGRLISTVDGRRTSATLTVEPTALPGVYAVSGLPERAASERVAVITMEAGGAAASAVVALDGRNAVVAVDVPSDRSPDGWVVPRAVTDVDVEDGLRLSAALSDATSGMADSPAGAALPALLLLPVGLLVALRAAGERHHSRDGRQAND